MPQVEQAPIRSAEDLRALYRALGVSEETLMRAIQFTELGSDGPNVSKIKRRPGRPPSKSPKPAEPPLRKLTTF
jgi:hypothetical protein